VLFCGYGYGNDGMEWYVGAMDSEGMNDNSFNTPPSQFYSANLNVAADMTVLSTNEVVVIGSSGSDAILVKLNADGSFSEEFGTDGAFALGIDGSDSGSDIDRNAEDDLMCTVNIYDGEHWGSRIYSFDADGSLNEDFGTLGSVDFPVGLAQVVLNEIRVQPDGHVVFAGYYQDVLSDIVTPFLGRLRPDGSFDEEFNGDGYAEIPLNTEGLSYQDIDFQFNDKIVTSGRNGDKIVITRYHSGGMLDVPVLHPGQSEIVLSPNPVSDFVDITWDASLQGFSHLELIDEAGRTIAAEAFSAAGTYRFDCRTLENGVYILRLNGETSGSAITRVMVCH
jgi:hypothetical protein